MSDDKKQDPSKSWEFQIDKTIIEDIRKNDSEKNENRKRAEFVDSGKQLRLDSTGLHRRKELRKLDPIKNIKINKPKREKAQDRPSAPLDKVLQAFFIDIIFFAVLFFMTNVVALKMSGSFEQSYDQSVFGRMAPIVRSLPGQDMQKSGMDLLVRMNEDPQTYIDAMVFLASKTFLLGAYILFFFLPQLIWGVSLGKAMAKVKVEHIDGGDLSFSQRLKRESFAKLVSLLTVVGPVFFFFNPQRRALHDYLGSSITVERD